MQRRVKTSGESLLLHGIELTCSRVCSRRIGLTAAAHLVLLTLAALSGQGQGQEISHGNTQRQSSGAFQGILLGALLRRL